MNYYYGLFTIMPDYTIKELSYKGYERQQREFMSTNQISFPEISESVIVTHFGVFESKTGGSPLIIQQVQTDKKYHFTDILTLIFNPAKLPFIF